MVGSEQGGSEQLVQTLSYSPDSGEYSTLITGVGGICGYMLWGRGIRER